MWFDNDEHFALYFKHKLLSMLADCKNIESHRWYCRACGKVGTHASGCPVAELKKIYEILLEDEQQQEAGDRQ